MADLQTYQFDVKMTCGGCSGAIERVLQKAKDANTVDELDFSVNLESQLVTVKTTLPYDDILARIKKTGKEVRSGKIMG
ncbi:hypothetical protein E1B28_008835 [Marasmius oreades]|uniref:HMA domain-containing protein n=1 Tax=Marasmius oreades TaxID=181124 RepID=A0A9P7RZR6_9AGAR|nr:uncharacterized protein E1B28_008835 [Marasmius oreades]KAG7092483.1 hypothetical protein E1B28_008835 [Marasmius oreades]